MNHPAPIHLVNQRRDAWRDIQYFEALIMCGCNDPRLLELADAAVTKYEAVANEVERARFSMVKE